MSDVRIRPRSSIADAELARLATVDLPHVVTLRRPQAPRAVDGGLLLAGSRSDFLIRRRASASERADGTSLVHV